MKEQKSSHIINVSSVAGHKVNPGGAVYATTKHGVRVISEGLRQEVKPHNIRTTIILPGAVATELPDSITEPDVAERVRKVYELAIPADSFASMVAFAMSQPEDVDQRNPVQADEAGILKSRAAGAGRLHYGGQREAIRRHAHGIEHRRQDRAVAMATGDDGRPHRDL
jgi:NAD(P)-dependent dehydrogenase (short-subunit alcohol dehydrogenase family)